MGKKETLLDMRLDGGVSKDEYDIKIGSLKKESMKLQIELEEYHKADYDFLSTISATLSLAKRAREVFDSSEIDQKRQLLNYLLQNPVVKDKKLYFTTKKPFDMLLNIPRVSVLGHWLNEFRTLDWQEIAFEIDMFEKDFETNHY